MQIKHLALLLLLLGSTHFVPAQDVVRVMQYNLLRYGERSCAPTQQEEANWLERKDTWLSSVLSHYKPHLLGVNEILPNEGFSRRLRARGFTYTDNIEYAELSNNAGSSIVNQVFYDTDKLIYLDMEVINSSPRDINAYHFIYNPDLKANGDTVHLYCVLAHLKASNSSSDVNRRTAGANAIMSWIRNNARGANVIVMGDMNFNSANEAGYKAFINDNDEEVRLTDPTGKTNSWAGSGNARFHTQSPRIVANDCGVAGGMDDRFDMILMSKSIRDASQSISLIENTYRVLGNDGNSYNDELFCSTSGSVPLIVCANLKQMSDHLPVVMDLQVDGTTSIRRNEVEGLTWQGLQNPITASMAFELSLNSNPLVQHEMSLFNQLGQEVQRWRLAAGTNSLAMPSVLPAGLYSLRVSNSLGQISTQKLIKF